MKSLKEEIILIRKELRDALALCKNEHELEKVRTIFLGRSGHLAGLMKHLKKLSVDDKRIFGPQLNQLKTFANEAYEQKKDDLQFADVAKEIEKHKYFDVTASHPDPLPATTHIYTQIVNELNDIFTSMGYTIADGPEVETDYYNFEALNIPGDHPAREMHDTFWLDVPGLLLRTHTSPVQIRTLEKQEAPLAIFSPGRCYRNEALDASHEIMFMQAECLLVDKDISVANLLATAQTFLQKLFDKKDLAIRVRPGYFPFVEPGLEIDAQCPFCTSGCSTCKKTTWIELLGSGLVHPNVLRYCNVDPTEYSGFAFGLGLARLAMIKHGISDIRLLSSNNVNFLDQF